MSSPLFDRIALSLSGGGFRAAAYSLGTLKGLYLLGLLDKVHMLSTASGGTITGAYYAMRRKRGVEFAQIYQDFYQLLDQDEILPQALARWESAIPSASYKLIQAFADTYSQEVYGEARLGLFWEPDPSPTAPFHLQSLIFGATEMYSGLTFRFQYGAFLPPPKGKLRDSYMVGNGNVWIKTQYARQLRLGDVVAASSCFPGGFEPLILPDDFFPHPTADMLGGGSKQVPGRIALLDGGIYDNQGIESLLRANERNAKYADQVKATHPPEQAALLQPTTLFLIADVSGADKDLYQAAPLTKVTSYSPTLRQAAGAGLGALAALGLAALWLSLRPGSQFWGGLLAGFAVVGLALAGLGFWAWHQLQQVLLGVGRQLPGWVLPRLQRFSLRQLAQLLALRFNSTKALLTSVFMRRVRSLNYEQVYRQPDQAKPSYEVMSSIIGRLVSDYEKGKPKKANSVTSQLAAVYPTICRAREMPTTLWWQGDKDRLPAIVASAEITLYYQLLVRFEKQPPPAGTPEAEVQRRAQLLWDAYQQKAVGQLLPIGAWSVLQQPAGTVEQLADLPPA
jgi:predicted acylesterase/phospholipase RssA